MKNMREEILRVLFPGLDWTEAMHDPAKGATMISARIVLELPSDFAMRAMRPGDIVDAIAKSCREQLLPILRTLGCDEKSVRSDERKRIAANLEKLDKSRIAAIVVEPDDAPRPEQQWSRVVTQSIPNWIRNGADLPNAEHRGSQDDAPCPRSS